MRALNRLPPTFSIDRLDGVDLLRGLAIFFVLMNHVNMRLVIAHVPYTNGLPSQLVSSLVWNGQYGVQIFFAISGFLITATALRRWGTPAKVDIRRFYFLRFARIAPLMILLLVVLSGLDRAHIGDFVVSAKTGGLGRALLAALTFHINLLEARRGYLPANWDILWSLSVEEMFYLAFPLLCRFLDRGKLLFVVLLGFVILGPFGRTVLAGGNPVWQEYSYLGGMDAIAMGCLTALFLTSGSRSRLLAGTGAVLMVVILCFSNQTRAWGLARTGLDMTILAVGTCLLISGAARTKWQSPRFLGPLLTLGHHSYEIYLTHMFVVFALFDWFVHAGSRLVFVPALFVAAIAIAGVLGGLAAHFYSEPLNARLRYGRVSIRR